MELYEKIEKLCAATKAASPSIAQASTKQKNETRSGPVFIGISYEVGISRLAMQPKPEHTERM